MFIWNISTNCISECQLSSDSSTLSCDVYGPLKPGDTHDLRVTYDVSSIEPFTPAITWAAVEVFGQTNFKDTNPSKYKHPF